LKDYHCQTFLHPGTVIVSSFFVSFSESAFFSSSFSGEGFGVIKTEDVDRVSLMFSILSPSSTTQKVKTCANVQRQ